MHPGAVPIHQHLAVFDCIQPSPILVIIGCVDHHQVGIGAAAVNQGVINHVGIWIKEVCIAGFSDIQGIDIICTDTVEEGGCIGTFRLVHAHVGNIKQASCLPGRQVLLGDRCVPNRHFPSSKRDDFCPHGFMDFIEGSAAQGFWFLLLPGKGGFGVTALAAIHADMEWFGFCVPLTR